MQVSKIEVVVILGQSDFVTLINKTITCETYNVEFLSFDKDYEAGCSVMILSNEYIRN